MAPCFFCQVRSGEKHDEFVVTNGDAGTVILDKFPITPGHLLAFPAAHTSDADIMDKSSFTELMLLTRRCAQALRHVYPGSLVGFFTAGKEIKEHCHVHVLTINHGLRFHFRDLSTVSRTAMTQEELQAVGEPIRSAWASLGKE